ncbi:hypothetical protein PENTCL1PPCAC_14507, partial [Pristionchus entomophagus]
MRDLEMNRFSQFGTVNELELVIARGAGQFVQRTVRVWKMYGIGQGRLFENLSGFTREFEEEEEEGGHLASSKSAEMDEASIKKGVNPEMFWTGYLTSKGKADEEPDDVDEIDEHGDETQGGSVHEGNFTCNECGVAFINEGWALRGKKKRVKYSTKAKNFANKMFANRLGDGSGRKMDPAEVERLMKENDQIKPFERMNAQQIRSYFGSLCKKQTNKRERKADKEVEEEEDWEDLADEDVE